MSLSKQIVAPLLGMIGGFHFFDNFYLFLVLICLALLLVFVD